MSLYRIVYKKFSVVAQNFQLVEDTVEASDMNVIDGCLVLLNDDGRTFMAIPAGAWAGADPAPEEEKTLSLVGGV